MKYMLCLAFFGLSASSYSQLNTDSVKQSTLRTILLEQLKTTHNSKDWFVPASVSVEDLTPEQANWKEGPDNHSIAQLATHLIFWNLQLLNEFEEKQAAPFGGDNKKTFAPTDAGSWKKITQQLDSVLTAWENAVASADEQKLEAWASRIAHIGTHNAYHTGQILYIRKMKGWWNEEKGVK